MRTFAEKVLENYPIKLKSFLFYLPVRSINSFIRTDLLTLNNTFIKKSFKNLVKLADLTCTETNISFTVEFSRKTYFSDFGMDIFLKGHLFLKGHMLAKNMQ